MKLILTLFSFFSILYVNGQSTEIGKVQSYIVYNQLDSAAYYLDKVREDSKSDTSLNEVLELFDRLIHTEDVSYKDYYAFIRGADSNPEIMEDLSSYLEKYVKKPRSRKKIDLDYVQLMWWQVYTITNLGNLDIAARLQKNLENYVNQFDDTDTDVIEAKTRISTHPIIMYIIQEDVENGKKLCLENIETAKRLNNPELQIMFKYHLTEFLVFERKLQEYIDVSEECLLLEKELDSPSLFYYATIEHLLDAYIHKGGHTERVLYLLEELSNSGTESETYCYYAELISSLAKDSPLKKEILKKFEVNDVAELISKFHNSTEGLVPNDVLRLLSYSAAALGNHGFITETLRCKDKEIDLTRKIYSEDLSKSLAKFNTEKAMIIKEQEIKYEKQQTKMFTILSILGFALLLASLFVLRKVRNQSSELAQKNKLISKTLEEKELLVKEVHHRVKNNFQMVSSLLELQTSGIEDEKALEIVNEGKHRIQSMALIHQKLYQNESGLIDFDEYITLLTKELSSLFASTHNVKTSISSDQIMFDVDTAIPLGLIINEIITNSYKYAFRNDRENNLSISIHKEATDREYKLVIEDNGPGLTADLDIKKSKSLGLRLVNILVKQLKGSLKQTNEDGAKFEIYFKDRSMKKAISYS